MEWWNVMKMKRNNIMKKETTHRIIRDIRDKFSPIE